jgi:membrane protease YdiL (CAAX protease family)
VALTDFYLAISSAIKKLLPTLLIFWIFGYGYKEMGIKHPKWKMTTVLLVLTSTFGLLTGIILQHPMPQVIILYLIGIFVNALPEELFFRGFLLPRLETVLENPLNALVISALLFNALHIPIQIHNGAALSTAILGIFSIGYPTGLLWGYLYLRTHSIIPGTLWHAANGILGYVMMS